MDELSRIAYDASLRALDKQEEVVRELRSRTAVVLAATSFAISLGGPASVRASTVLGIAAVAASLTGLGGSIYVLLPQRRLRFSIHGGRTLDTQRTTTTGQTLERLVYDLDRMWWSNDVLITRLLGAFRWSAASLAAEIVLVVSALAGTL